MKYQGEPQVPYEFFQLRPKHGQDWAVDMYKGPNGYNKYKERASGTFEESYIYPHYEKMTYKYQRTTEKVVVSQPSSTTVAGVLLTGEQQIHGMIQDSRPEMQPSNDTSLTIITETITVGYLGLGRTSAFRLRDTTVNKNEVQNVNTHEIIR